MSKAMGIGAPIADMCTSLCAKSGVARMELDESEIVVSMHGVWDHHPGRWVWLRSGVGFFWRKDGAA